MVEEQTINMPALKVASVWTAVGITSWADFASMLAAFYTLLLFGEWIWKKCKRWRK